MRLLIVFLLISGGIFLGCNNNKEPKTENITTINLKQSTITSKKIFTIKDVVELSKTDELIVSINKVKFYRDKYFVHDRKLFSVNSFDEKGGHLNKYGKRGSNLGEYQDAWDFDIDTSKGNVIILSNRTQQFHYYDIANSSYISSKNLPMYVYSFLKNGKMNYFFINQYKSELPNYHNLLVTDENFQNVVRLSPYSKKWKSIGGISGFLTEYKNNFNFASQYSSVVYQLTNKNELSPKYSFIFEKPLPDNIFQNPDNYNGNIFDFSFLENRFYESNNSLLFLYANKSKSKWGSYIKRENKFYDLEKTGDALLFKLISSVVGTKDEGFIGVILPENILHLKEEEGFDKVKKYNTKLYDVFLKVTEDSNPVLIIIYNQ